MSDPFKVCYLAPASSLNGQTPPAKPTLKSIRTRRNTSLSCSACRLRKTKCLGGPPCGNCVKHKTECRREEDKDGRRQTSLKRKLIELEKDRRLLVRLLETIRDEEDVKVTQLLNLIRSNASHDEIRPSVAGGRQRSISIIRPDADEGINEDISTAHDSIESRTCRNVMAIRSLCNAA
ncbi:hypothetical protein KXX16_005012 [Aspergillus fumigatus]|nr:hypothetical protein KXX47_004919 [Aspergillus fumigatus]KMK62857.1 C6 zinc finger domain-containing protein [Aspergillus fumigatus Z5]KAH1312712.1 hypothetical protein KXX38_004362 [Aspergillus fumigatus]KAH1389764.1 hypothetical protein KXX10_009192 [Aspergillus fumigatus]KAH1396605.1 hypothetical protein KXX49_007579 [Aspergillus fumigatus]